MLENASNPSTWKAEEGVFELQVTLNYTGTSSQPGLHENLSKTIKTVVVITERTILHK